MWTVDAGKGAKKSKRPKKSKGSKKSKKLNNVLIKNLQSNRIVLFQHLYGPMVSSFLISSYQFLVGDQMTNGQCFVSTNSNFSEL